MSGSDGTQPVAGHHSSARVRSRRDEPWIAYTRPRTAARLRLFCLPYAGAGASVFRPWLNAFGDHIDVCAVQFPGRETRLSEKPATDMPVLVDALARGLEPHLDRPFALFGHSMGGLVGFELARHLRRRGGPTPLHLFASGCRAPHLPPKEPLKYLGSDPELREELRRLGGTPAAVLDDAEFIDWYLPTLRADFTLCDTYEYAGEDPLDLPITALHGEKDPDISQEDARQWVEHTRRAFSIESFPGGHLFLQSHRSLVLKTMAQALAAMARVFP
jgi:medium-chain acyl-[acyl-carrier-protein] hydrolase